MHCLSSEIKKKSILIKKGELIMTTKKVNLSELNYTIEPKKVRRLRDEGMKKRLGDMLRLREEYLKNPDDIHIVLQKGNTKTKDGKVYHTRTVSLIPIVDCPNCKECMKDCYDLRNVCFQKYVKNDRARNSALHKANPAEYWRQVEEECKKELDRLPENEFIFLRINIGGDLTDEDFEFVNNMVERNLRLLSQFFTKNDEGINQFMETHGDFNERICKLLSQWEGMECNNPYGIPEAHVLFDDGRTTADFSRPHYFCNGDCNNCMETNSGCKGLKRGEQIILSSH